MENEAINLRSVEDKIIPLRNEKAILDSDVAALYGVETKRINEAVVNNPEKFPVGYILSLDNNEWKILKSKFSTSNWGGKQKLPKAFTEKGLYMLATILKSPAATQTTIAIVETFTKLRELARTVSELANTQEKETQKSLMQKGGELIADVLGKELQVSNTETSFELNLALVKFKHTVTQSKELEDMKKLIDEQRTAIERLTNNK
jgi:hypothetical protein